MTKRILPFLLLALGLLTAGVTPVPPLTAASVDAAAAHYAETLKSGPPEAIAAFYADDGELQLPGMDALRGPAAIRAFLEPMAAVGVVDACTMQSDLTTVAGNEASQFGHYTQTAGERGKDHKQYSGRYAALWRWDGSKWHIVRLMMQPK